MKKYKIPQQIIDIHTEYLACKDMMDSLIDANAKYKNILKTSIECQKKKNEFFRKCLELYPDLENKRLNYDPKNNYITILEES
jgi:hypothetical protein